MSHIRRPTSEIPFMAFPTHRMRRLRRSERLRNLVRETRLSPESMIYPIFVCPGEKVRNEIGSDAYDDNGIVQQALRAIRENVRNLLLVTDVCLCEYTSHGHCGVIKHSDVQNDPTLKLLADSSVSHVRAGADMVAPSDMMDGSSLLPCRILVAEHLALHRVRRNGSANCQRRDAASGRDRRHAARLAAEAASIRAGAGVHAPWRQRGPPLGGSNRRGHPSRSSKYGEGRPLPRRPSEPARSLHD